MKIFVHGKWHFKSNVEFYMIQPKNLSEKVLIIVQL